MHSTEVAAYGLPSRWEPLDKTAPWKGGTYTGRVSLQKYTDTLLANGFEGLTSYLYHNYSAVDNRASSPNFVNTSYSEMLKTYRAHWNHWLGKFKSSSQFDYQIPVAMGWDNRPNGGTWYNPVTGKPTEPKKDFGHGGKQGFKTALQEAKSISNKSKKNITICCWNEYTEGNYIEPTIGSGYAFVEAIKEVFGTQPLVPIKNPPRNTYPASSESLPTRPTRTAIK
jgi:hypothetical protein